MAAILLLVCASEADAQRGAPREKAGAAGAAESRAGTAQVSGAARNGREDRRVVLFRSRRAASRREGVLVTIPPHAGPASLLFSFHNRHTYSDEAIRSGRGYAKYTAVVAVLTMTGEMLDRGAVQSEFGPRRISYERISGVPGPAASRPSRRSATRRSPSRFPAAVNEVSILGEVLDATTAAGRETATPGRTVAVISNVRVEYRPAPVKRVT